MSEQPTPAASEPVAAVQPLPEEAPLVVLIPSSELVSNPRRPRPGLIEAILWCVIFLLTQLTAALVVTAGVLAGFAVVQEHPWEFALGQLAALGQGQRSGGEKLDSSPDTGSRQEDQTSHDSRQDQAPPDSGQDREQPPTVETSSAKVPREISLALVYGMLGAQVASWWLIRRVVPRVVGTNWKQKIGWRRPRVCQLLIVLLAVVPFMVLAGGLQELLKWLGAGEHLQIADSLRAIFQHAPLVVTLAATALGPGVVEEVWCRGFLGHGLTVRYGLIPGVVWTSLLFGLLHLDPAYALVTAAMGAYLHFVFLMCGSIVAPIMLHTLNNALAVLATLYPSMLPALATDGPGLSLVGYALAVIVLVGCSYALWRTRPRTSLTI
jgi:membrane protease YdiL (CAAX protease family)